VTIRHNKTYNKFYNFFVNILINEKEGLRRRIKYKLFISTKYNIKIIFYIILHKFRLL